MTNTATDTDMEAVVRKLGNLADLARDLQRFRNSARLLSSRQARLIEKYPKQWVAVYRGRVRAHARTLQGLMREIDEKGLPREDVITRFVDKNQRTFIL